MLHGLSRLISASGARLLWGCALLSLLAALGGGAAARTAQSPTDVVEAFHSALVEVMMEGEALGPDGRYRKLAGPVDAAFNLPVMIRIAAGSHWRKTDLEAQRRLFSAFRRFSIANYAANFTSYSGEVFVTLGETPGRQKTVMVETLLKLPNDDDVTLTYVTREAKDGWRIIDVLLEGRISELALRRSQYGEVLKDSGADGLVTILLSKADKMVGAEVR